MKQNELLSNLIAHDFRNLLTYVKCYIFENIDIGRNMMAYGV